MDGSFPDCPIAGTTCLVPITSWQEMRAERKVTGVDYDLFWDESISEGVAYFFSWRGEPRATVLVVWADRALTHIECRGVGDQLLSAIESRPIFSEIVQAFAAVGFRRSTYVLT